VQLNAQAPASLGYRNERGQPATGDRFGICTLHDALTGQRGSDGSPTMVLFAQTLCIDPHFRDIGILFQQCQQDQFRAGTLLLQ
jgi:hypothetical protein